MVGEQPAEALAHRVRGWLEKRACRPQGAVERERQRVRVCVLEYMHVSGRDVLVVHEIEYAVVARREFRADVDGRKRLWDAADQVRRRVHRET